MPEILQPSHFVHIIKKPEIKIYSLGDIHFGNNENGLRKNFTNIVKEIQKDENAYWVSHGDIFENATRSSLSDPQKSLPINEELKLMRVILNPIAEKCLGMIGGNHGTGRSSRDLTLNPDRELSEHLKVPFDPFSCVVQITVNARKYVIFIFHGRSTGITIGAKFNGFERMEKVVSNADIYLAGHTHQYGHIPVCSFEIDRIHDHMRILDKHYVNGGHMLDYVSYARQYGYRPLPYGQAVMTLRSAYKDGITINKITGDQG